MVDTAKLHMDCNHSVDTVAAWLTLECAASEEYKVMSSVTVLIRLSVVTNGNNNLMPTISPFAISDKTLISQKICTPCDSLNLDFSKNEN